MLFSDIQKGNFYALLQKTDKITTISFSSAPERVRRPLQQGAWLGLRASGGRAVGRARPQEGGGGRVQGGVRQAMSPGGRWAGAVWRDCCSLGLYRLLEWYFCHRLYLRFIIPFPFNQKIANNAGSFLPIRDNNVSRLQTSTAARPSTTATPAGAPSPARTGGRSRRRSGRAQRGWTTWRTSARGVSSQ